MPHVKVDDRLPWHPKMLKALSIEPLAFGAYVAGLCYSNLNRTDGFLPALSLKGFVHVKERNVVKALTEAGLWHAVDGGYAIHDYLDHQTSSEQILKKLRADSARKTNGKRAEA